VSGITIATILFAALVLVAFLGKDSTIGPVAAVMIGAVVCCAACIAGDNLQDLKAGYIVGATPWRQQVMLAIGALSSAAVMAPTLNLLAKSYGIGPGTPLEAAQANLMASIARGIFGGALPWDMIAVGAVLAVVIIVFDLILKAKKAPFRVPVLAAAVGLYLPLVTMVPIFLGGLLNYLVARSFGKGLSEDEVERKHRGGMVFAAGLITGEALMGIFMAIPIYATEKADALALPSGMQLTGAMSEWVGLAVLGFVAMWLYRVGKKSAA
jgi:putative OPT family oligopeptide transporter